MISTILETMSLFFIFLKITSAIPYLHFRDILFTLHLQGHVVSSVRAVFKDAAGIPLRPLDVGEHLIDLPG